MGCNRQDDSGLSTDMGRNSRQPSEAGFSLIREPKYRAFQGDKVIDLSHPRKIRVTFLTSDMRDAFLKMWRKRKRTRAEAEAA